MFLLFVDVSHQESHFRVLLNVAGFTVQVHIRAGVFTVQMHICDWFQLVFAYLGDHTTVC